MGIGRQLMEMNPGTEVVVVVMERGAEWPRCVDACRRITPDTVVVAESENEPPEALARRVESRLRALDREGRPVKSAIMSVSGRPSPTSASGAEMAEQRSGIARSLLSALKGNGTESTLWVCTPSRVPDALRHELIALAGTLTSAPASSSVSIALQFADGLRLPDSDEVPSCREPNARHFGDWPSRTASAPLLLVG